MAKPKPKPTPAPKTAPLVRASVAAIAASLGLGGVACGGEEIGTGNPPLPDGSGPSDAESEFNVGPVPLPPAPPTPIVTDDASAFEDATTFEAGEFDAITPVPLPPPLPPAPHHH